MNNKGDVIATLKGQRMRTRCRGFTLVELMVVVAILSIILMIAIPAYLDYTIRTKVSEGMVMLGAVKQSVADTYYSSGGVWPTSNGKAGMLSSASYQTKYIDSITISGAGVVVVDFGLADLAEADDSITLVPSANPGGIDWDCTGGSMLSRYRPPVCRP